MILLERQLDAGSYLNGIQKIIFLSLLNSVDHSSSGCPASHTIESVRYFLASLIKEAKIIVFPYGEFVGLFNYFSLNHFEETSK